jgi:head-tail adaptor
MRATAGAYRTVVTVKQITQAANASGHLADTPSDYCTRRARIESGGGSQQQTEAHQEARRQLVLYLPWDSTTDTITSLMHVVIGSRTLDIEAVENVDGLNEEMRITCVETEA